MEKISDRILKIIEAEKLSTRHFEHLIGCSNGVLAKAILKKSDIQSIWVSKIIETFPSYDAKWLLTGQGDMLIIVNENKNCTNLDFILSLLKQKDKDLRDCLIEIGSLTEQIKNLKKQVGYTISHIAAEPDNL